MNLLIVESGAKSKTIQKYLGRSWYVPACNGHVQDLPTDRSSKDGKKAMWAAGEDTLPAPPWQWTDKAERTVEKILAKAKEKDVSHVYIATDPDREGEFIAWRLGEILGEEGFDKIQRISFNEITKTAINQAIDQGGEVNMNLVDAAKVRRFMDRLVGFRASRFSRSWRLTSMGRVQTPTLGFVVERELEREAFVPLPYFSVSAIAGGVRFSARFHEKDEAGAWFDEKEKHHPNRTNDETLATGAFDSLVQAEKLTLDDVRQKGKKSEPKPPFTTDTLLQAAGSLFGWNPRRVMQLAGELYNAGHITYMRTDSTRTNATARDEIKEYIQDTWGADHVGQGVVGKDAKGAQNVQDAHEAIRPTRVQVNMPEDLGAQQAKLYQLVWARFTGSQMSPSRYDGLSFTASVDGFEKTLTGSASWRVHTGWEAAYQGLRKDPETAPPPFAATVGTVISLDADEDENPKLTRDTTKPPARYKQHTLVQKMKAEGIGRPSTYATTIEKLLNRKYCLDEDNSLAPTEDGRTLWTVVAPYYSASEAVEDSLFSTSFTAEMEATLDGIEAGERDAAEAWHRFVNSFREIHQHALDRKKLTPTPKQLAFFERLVANMSPEEVHEVTGGRPAAEVNGEEMAQLIDTLKDAHPLGAIPVSEKQSGWIQRMAESLKLPESEAAGLVDTASFAELTGGRDGTASKLIEILREREGKLPRDASEKQLKWVKQLADKAGLEEKEACQLVDAADWSALTGGRNGTASKLITVLRDQAKAKREAEAKDKKKD